MTFKITRLLTLLLVTTLIFSGCKEDKDDSKLKGTLTVNGTDYEIDQAFYAYTDPDDDLQSGQLYFTTAGVELEETDKYDSFAGEGYMLMIGLSGEPSADFPVGAYTAGAGASAIFYQIDSEWTRMEYSVPGSLQISKSGDHYTITAALIDDENGEVEIEVTFTGTFADAPFFYM